MQARKDTRPEMQLRRALHARGLRYRVGIAVPGLPRRTLDIAFPSLKLAVFVDGCFWHGCPEHATWPAANREWWEDKIRANSARDRATTAHLEAHGWSVVRVWEHESTESAAERVRSVLAVLRTRLIEPASDAPEGPLPPRSSGI